jgi:hypothetical protein
MIRSLSVKDSFQAASHPTQMQYRIHIDRTAAVAVTFFLGGKLKAGI